MAPSLGVALGSGGARGIAHVSYIEAIDELGLAPSLIAGTSMGALIGAAWASGMSGAHLRDYVSRVTTIREIVSRLWASGQTAPLRQFGVNIQADPVGIVRSYLPEAFPVDFAALTVAFVAVATDYFRGEQRAFASGPLFEAIAASMAIPGLFRALRVDGRLFIDGGTVNPLPVDHVRPRTDILVAIDVNGQIHEPPAGAADPTPFDIGFGATQIMSRTLARNAIAQHPPDVFVEAPVSGVGVLEFWRAADILARADADKDGFKRKLAAAVERFEARR